MWIKTIFVFFYFKHSSYGYYSIICGFKYLNFHSFLNFSYPLTETS